jgi:hypothetical protein
MFVTAATPAGTMGRLSTTECTYLPTYLPLATWPPMTTSVWYVGTAPGIRSLGAACHRGRGSLSRGLRTAAWRASHALRPGIP